MLHKKHHPSGWCFFAPLGECRHQRPPCQRGLAAKQTGGFPIARQSVVCRANRIPPPRAARHLPLTREVYGRTEEGPYGEACGLAKPCRGRRPRRPVQGRLVSLGGRDVRRPSPTASTKPAERRSGHLRSRQGAAGCVGGGEEIRRGRLCAKPPPDSASFRPFLSDKEKGNPVPFALRIF